MQRALLLLFVLAGCSAPGGGYASGETWYIRTANRTDGITTVSSNYGSPKETPPCPRPHEWELLTWPELDPVATTSTAPSQDASGLCAFTLTPDAPLGDRWYALHWTGTDPQGTLGARALRDGTWVWLFHGVTHASVYLLEQLSLDNLQFVQAQLTEETDLAPGTTWASLMTVTQQDATCWYPGDTVTVGNASIGFGGIPVAECQRVDWNLPVHVHIEGLLTHAAPHAPVPVVDVDVTFGDMPDHVLDAAGDPPACTDPRCL